MKTLPLFETVETSQRNGKRKTPDGIATSDLILSAYVGNNAEIFPLVLKLHVPEGSRVAAVSRIKQQNHARKNHSYFIVFVKTARTTL